MREVNIRDLAGNCSMLEAARAGMAVIDSLQVIPDKGARLLGIVAAFIIMVEETGMSLPDVISYARNCMNEASGKRPEFEAVRQYLENEILN